MFKRSSGERLTRDEKGKTIEPLTLTLETERDILDTHICIRDEIFEIFSLKRKKTKMCWRWLKF